CLPFTRELAGLGLPGQHRGQVSHPAGVGRLAEEYERPLDRVRWVLTGPLELSAAARVEAEDLTVFGIALCPERTCLVFIFVRVQHYADFGSRSPLHIQRDGLAEN